MHLGCVGVSRWQASTNHYRSAESIVVFVDCLETKRPVDLDSISPNDGRQMQSNESKYLLQMQATAVL